IVRVVVRLSRPQPTARVAGLRVLDLHHFGTEPGQRLGAGRPGFELSEIDNADTGEKLQLCADVWHGNPPPDGWLWLSNSLAQGVIRSKVMRCSVLGGQPGCPVGSPATRLPQIVPPP